MRKPVPTIVHFFRIYYKIIGFFFQKYAAKSLIKLFSTPRQKKKRKKEQIILKKAKKSSIKVGSDNLITYEWGNGEKLAMLFHGWESNAGSLGGFVSLLTTQGYKVVSFDAPAHGESKGKRANLIYFKKAAKAMIDFYGIPEIAIGHSLGANSIIMVAYEDNIKIDKTILIAPLNRLLNVFEDMKELLQLNESLYQKFIENFESSSGYSFSDFYFHTYGKNGPLEKILLLHDKNDKVTNYSHSIEMNNVWDKVKLIPIEDSGHYKILWNPKVFKESLNFILKYN